MEPNPTEVAPWYLRNINQALALDSTTGNVYMRTGFAGNIVIEGNVQIPGTVTVDSTPEDPVHVHLDEIGTSGILNVPYMPIGNTNVTVTINSWSNVTNSVMQTAIISNVISDGTVVYAQTCSSRSDIAISGGDGLGAIQPGRDVNGNTDVLVYTVAWTQPNTDLLWKLAWDEFTNN
jgi:hypothetical protein